MCVTCGCGQDENAAVSMPGDPMSHEHHHDHDHHNEHQGEHEHVHADGTRHRHSHADNTSVAGRDSRTLQLEKQILGKNQLIAERNRGWLEGRGVLALNLLSSPGAGKTSLLERTLGDLKSELKIAVVEGDQATSNDARRIRDAGARAVQINTGTGCHLEAEMIERANKHGASSEQDRGKSHLQRNQCDSGVRAALPGASASHQGGEVGPKKMKCGKDAHGECRHDAGRRRERQDPRIRRQFEGLRAARGKKGEQ